MSEKERFGIANEYISLPEEVTAEDVSRLSHYLTNGKGLAESAALRILEQAREMSRQEKDRWFRSEAVIDFANNRFISWDGYKTPAYAFLNAVEMLRSGRPFQAPEEDGELILKISERKLMGDFWYSFGIRVNTEAVVANDIAEWHIKSSGQLDILLKDRNPLVFVDTIINREKINLHGDSGNDRRKKIALEQGGLRFKSLYEAAVRLKA